VSVAPAQTRITKRGWWVIGAVALLVVLGIYEAAKPTGPSKAVAAYCKTIQVGTTTALNTEGALGNPDTTITHTVDGLPTLYLGYGSVAFFYDSTGELDSSRLAGQTGCPRSS
jgi:hypothetical protein